MKVKRLIEVEKLKKSDIDEFRKIVKKIILNSPYYSDYAKKGMIKEFKPKKIKESIKEKNNLFISVKSKGKIIGFQKGFFEGSVESGVYWLEWIGIDEGFLRMKVASEILNFLIKFLKKKKAHKIVCAIKPDNKASLSLFKKRGFSKQTYLKKHWFKEDFYMVYRFL